MPPSKSKQHSTRATKRTNLPARPKPKPRQMTREELLAHAYSCLNVDPKAVESAPKISHVLAKLPGGIDQAIEYLRGSDTDDAQKWLRKYDGLLVTYRAILPLEAICLAVDIQPRRMLEVITGACFEQADVTARLLAAASHPEVVKSTVRSAVYDGAKGMQDRKMLHLQAKFLPIPKNQTTFVAPGAIGAQHNTQLNIDQRTQYAVTEIANIERRQERISNRYNDEVLGLGDSKPVPQLMAGAQVTQHAPEPEAVDAELANLADTEADVTDDVDDSTWSSLL